MRTTRSVKRRDELVSSQIFCLRQMAAELQGAAVSSPPVRVNSVPGRAPLMPLRTKAKASGFPAGKYPLVGGLETAAPCFGNRPKFLSSRLGVASLGKNILKLVGAMRTKDEFELQENGIHVAAGEEECFVEKIVVVLEPDF